MDNMREEFEEWFSEIGSASVLADTMKDDTGNYYFSETRLLWACWQSSRQALVVELPKQEDSNWGCLPYEKGLVDGMNAMLEDCQSAVERAGLSYK